MASVTVLATQVSFAGAVVGATEFTQIANNIELTVPFFAVRNIENSVRFYIAGLGFQMKKQWTPEGKLRLRLLSPVESR